MNSKPLTSSPPRFTSSWPVRSSASSWARWPTKPGVYWFLSLKDQVLYVGKAKNLKNRLQSYRRLSNKASKINQLLSQAKKVKCQTLTSDFEATLVETELIKIHQPPFNTRQKDDKSPLYILITSDFFPKVLTKRKTDLPDGKHNRTNIFGPYPSGYKTRLILKLIRRIFPYCNSISSRNKSKACFYYHLGLCPGACIEAITRTVYLKNIKKIKLFLKGKTSQLLRQLKSELKHLTASHQFEKCITLRDQIKAIEQLTAAAPSPEINLPLLQEDIASEQLTHLKKLLSLPANYPLIRIEGYDISNISGKFATGSLVVFINGQPSYADYRHFRIRLIDFPDDVAMMRQIITRRLKHSDWPQPQLFVIDGGKTQLQAVLKITPASIPAIGLAKNPDRVILPNLNKKTKASQYKTIALTPNQPASRILTQIRNESHRFAKNYHLKLRLKNLNF